jgi:hypothetical protein
MALTVSKHWKIRIAGVPPASQFFQWLEKTSAMFPSIGKAGGTPAVHFPTIGNFLICVHSRLFAVTIVLALFAVSRAEARFPFTDPDNDGGWVLNEEMSDEFEGRKLDEEKWLVQGRDGEYRSNFKGRAYSTDQYVTGWQFSPDNVRVEDGMLKITTRHEPDYNWAPFANPGRDDTNICEFTTGGISTKQTFTCGYMEIKCKAADAQTTSAFWTTGSHSELDVFEAIGRHPTRTHKMWSSLHDWKLPTPNYPWTETHDLPFSFGDGFHVYGAEWDADSVKIYAEGKLIATAEKEWVEENGIKSKRWPLTGGQHVWVDSEIFPWWGVPDPDTLPADYEVEYVRVWQRPGVTPAPEKTQTARPLRKGDSDLEHFVGLEKAKWEKNGWRWNQSKVEELFREIDADHDGIASGVEKKNYWNAQ